jgi:hypothetical protein
VKFEQHHRWHVSGVTVQPTWKGPNADANQVVKQTGLPAMSESQGNVAIIGAARDREEKYERNRDTVREKRQAREKV